MATKISIKLLIDNRGQRVLFAEAGKDFADFIFSLLTLPIGSITKLLSSASMPGSIGNLYQGVKSINSTYLLPNKDKSFLLEPKICLSGSSSNLLLGGDSSSLQTKIYLCYYNSKCATASFEKGAICPRCGYQMDSERTLINPYLPEEISGNGKSKTVGQTGGLVRDVVTYTITDNLEVAPASANVHLQAGFREPLSSLGNSNCFLEAKKLTNYTTVIHLELER
jgi:Protein of unknown function (DUF674)